MPEIERIETHPPPRSGQRLSFGIVAVSLVVLAGMAADRKAVAATVVAMVGAVFAGWLSWRGRPAHRMVLTREGLAWRTPSPRTIAWSHVEGLGATEVTIDGEATVAFHVYTRNEGDQVFTRQWVGAEAFAAALQAGRLDPTATLDLPRALENAPRASASIALGVDAKTLERLRSLVDAAFADAGVQARVSARRLHAETELGTFELRSLAVACLGSPVAGWDAHARTQVGVWVSARRTPGREPPRTAPHDDV